MTTIAFDRDRLPRHDDIAAAFLAAAAAILGEALPARPAIERINEDYGSRQEEHYRYGTAKLGLIAHAVGMMSGHGRHGTKTTWAGQGFALRGESQRYGLGRSFATLHGATPAAEEAFALALRSWDVAGRDDGAAQAAVDAAVGRWQTGTGWDHAGLRADLEQAVAGSRAESAPGATVRFLLARLRLLAGDAAGAEALLCELLAQGEELAFSRGLACGLSADGSLWYLYRPRRTPPPWPHLEVRLALGRAAELAGDVAGAVVYYTSVGEVGADLRGGIRPDEQAATQLERLGHAAV